MNGWEQGGGQTGEDHMGCWQSSWWLYTWGGITWDSGSTAGGYTHGVGMMVNGAGMRGGGGGWREEGEVRLSEWGGVNTCQQ